MKNTTLLSMCLVFLACSIEQTSGVNQFYGRKGEEAIEFCIESYFSQYEKLLPDEADHAYVLATSQKLDVLFTTGEVGIFGPRSSAYKAILACGVLTSGDMSIYFLGSPLEDPLVSVEGEEQITDSQYDEEIWELLFKKKGTRFDFVDSQLSKR